MDHKDYLVFHCQLSTSLKAVSTVCLSASKLLGGALRTCMKGTHITGEVSGCLGSLDSKGVQADVTCLGLGLLPLFLVFDLA